MKKEAMKMPNEISAQELREKIERKEKLILLDARTEEEYKNGHLKGAVLIPYEELRKRHNELYAAKDAAIIVYCRSGKRSAKAAKTLKKLGYKNIANLAGGILEWEENGYPVSR
jgi:rhodanese-related sulfurtransferase